MTAAILNPPEFRWSCPNCDKELVTHRPEMPIHRCKGLGGLSAPFVTAGTKAKTEAVERGDWINGDLVQTDAWGRPVMSVVTTRDEGTDCVVLAPTASASTDGRRLPRRQTHRHPVGPEYAGQYPFRCSEIPIDRKAGHVRP